MDFEITKAGCNKMMDCAGLGVATAKGKVGFVGLDEKSLKVGGKIQKTGDPKRKRDNGDVDNTTTSPECLKPTIYHVSKEAQPRKKRESQRDIRTTFGAPPRPAFPPPPAEIVDPDLRDLIETSNLTPFRKRVLLALCQVPKGQVVRHLP